MTGGAAEYHGGTFYAAEFQGAQHQSPPGATAVLPDSTGELRHRLDRGFARRRSVRLKLRVFRHSLGTKF